MQERKDLERAVSPSALGDDVRFDASLRPAAFTDFVGQTKVKGNLQVYVEAARRRGAAMDHVLLSGPPGLGKTTLAHIIANEIDTEIACTSGPAIERARDLAGVLTNLNERDVLFIDEIHRLPVVVEEYLYAAMEDFAIDLTIDQGPHARILRLDLKPFTLIGATTREGLLTSAFRSRFGVLEKLRFYTPEELTDIILRSAGILSVEITDEAASRIAMRARGTPRIANRFLRRIRDVAEIEGDGRVTAEIADRGLEMLGIDDMGLDETDRRILRTVLEHAGAAVGIKTIAAAIGESEDTIEEVYEPFLLQQGLLRKTARGRLATERAHSHLQTGGAPGPQKELFG